MKAQSIVLALAGLAVSAQATAEVVLEEVIVTAQRREQSLQDVPVSVTAFGGEQIERNNIRSARDFLSLTPNVSFTDDGQAGARSLGIAIRGINNLVSGENAFINSVGIYVDEFSIGSVPQGVPNLFTTDMASIEVLRGPQGTYFGRNSLGGALNYRTNDPNFDAFAAKLIVGGESYEDAGDMYNITGVFNVPVSDNFGLRGVVYWEDSSGLVENICAAGATTGCPGAIENGFTTNGAEDSGHEWLDIRVKALWEPTDQTTVKATFFYSDQDQGTDENVPSGVLDLDSVDTFGVTSASDPGTGFWPNNRNKNSHDLPESNQLETIVFIANIAHELTDDLTVKWISGVIDVEQTRLFDNDLVGGLDALSRDNLYEGLSWSTELRFELTKDRYDLVGGLLYAQDEQNQRNNVAVSSDATGTIGGVGILPPFPPGLGLARNTKSFEVESIALFGDLTWRFTDDLEGFIGLRLTHDQVDNSYLGFGLMPGAGGPPTFTNVQRGGATGSQEFDDISGRAGLRYQVNDEWSFYGSFSKGYKAGGTSLGDVVTATSTQQVVPFDQEELYAIEGGFKAELLDQRMRLNASVFQNWWRDLQLEAFRFLVPGDLSSNFEQTININEATGYGVEAEMLFAVTDRFTVSASFGALSTEIEQSSPAVLTGGFSVNLVGLEIPKSPEFTANVAGEYRFPLASGEASLRLEYIHRDGQYSDVEGLTNQQTTGPSPNSGLSRALVGQFPYLSPDYDLLNFRAGYDMGPWSFNFYVQNLTDEEYYTGTQENFGLSGIRLRPNPRFFGGFVSYTFGEL